jgi:hypothetical protein
MFNKLVTLFDSFVFKVAGFNLDAALGNAYSLNRRAVMRKL